ncbi:MAG: DMT family transporter [Proteobacteria bacterium]|nr:DMT family transporter [Pseudomonadota bacterium]NBT04375.1 DMT family transporter [Pseudomonadota bacterium]NBT19983.1 DMT family transporter [Pseudomonadota bacterium]NBY48329.1 DMT family transporter [Pseudomonadota bacterium]NDG97837.1 DMT family transporter [Pseudomonadota bacterium]
MGLLEFGVLLFLGALWSTAFLFLRLGTPEFGPAALVGVRITVASVIVVGYVWGTGQTLPDCRDWRKWLLVGVVNTALPFFLFSFSELRITSSLASVMNSTTPFFGAILSATWLRQTMSWQKIGGLVAGFGGVLLVVGWDQELHDVADYVSALAALGGGASYAVGTLLVRRLFPMASSVTLAAGQQVGAAVVMAPIGLLLWPSVNPGWVAWTSVLILAVFLTALAYLIFFWLVARAGALAAMTVTFLLPVFGVVWGSIFLSEPLGPVQVAGLVVILGSLAMVNELRWRQFFPSRTV